MPRRSVRPGGAYGPTTAADGRCRALRTQVTPQVRPYGGRLADRLTGAPAAPTVRAVTSLGRRVDQAGKAVALGRRLVRMERAGGSPPHPGMWARGFLSNRLHHYPGISEPGAVFVPDVAVFTRLGRLNSAEGKRLLRDKAVFAAALAERGLAAAAPQVYGEVVDGAYVPASDRAAGCLRGASTVVVKPALGHGGRGVQRVPGPEVERRAWPAEPRLLVQELVEQHPDLAAISPGALNTLRVLTVRLPGRGPVVAAAVHRWATRSSGGVDNVSSGGLCSGVDLATGRLSAAVGMPTTPQRVPYAVHPDTGQPVAGVVVPQWDEVRALALDLMAAFPEVDHVGWDLCVSTRGPLVIEGNAEMPNPNVFQFHGSFLADPQLRRYYADRGVLPARAARH